MHVVTSSDARYVHACTHAKPVRDTRGRFTAYSVHVPRTRPALPRAIVAELIVGLALAFAPIAIAVIAGCATVAPPVATCPEGSNRVVRCSWDGADCDLWCE